MKNWINKNIALSSGIFFGLWMAGWNFFDSENRHILSFIAEFFVYGGIYYLVMLLAQNVGIFGKHEDGAE